MSRAVLVLVALAWIWPMLIGVVDLVQSWDRLTNAQAVLTALKGRWRGTEWSAPMWLIQGGHFWTALAVCWATWRVCRQDSAEAPRT